MNFQSILKGGDGDNFYIVEEGKLYAIRNETGDEKIMEYTEGAYFGEIALVRAVPR